MTAPSPAPGPRPAIWWEGGPSARPLVPRAVTLLAIAGAALWRHAPDDGALTDFVADGLGLADGAPGLYAALGLARLGVALACAAALALAVLRRRRCRYRLTAEAVSVERGLVRHTREVVPLQRVIDVGTSAGPVLRHYGLADLTIRSSDPSAPVLVLRAVPDADALGDALLTAAAERRRALHVHEFSVLPAADHGADGALGGGR